MTKYCWTAGLIGLALVAGCTTTMATDRHVIVLVDPAGHLRSQGFSLAHADLPAFAREVGGKPVVLLPRNSPSYGKAVEAKEQLQAAGIRNVTIGGESVE